MTQLRPCILALALVGAATVRAAEPEPQHEAVRETLSIGNAEIWVMGEPVAGPEVACAFDGTHLSIGGIVIPPPDEAASDTKLQRMYTAAPRFQELLASGATLRRAVEIYEGEKAALIAEACEADRTHGERRMRAVLVTSPLIEIPSLARTPSGGTMVRFKKETGLFPVTLDCDAEPTVAAAADARKRSARLRAALAAPGPKLIVAGRSGISTIAGRAAVAAARAQLEHVRRTRSTNALPTGPLNPSSEVFQDLVQRTTAAPR